MRRALALACLFAATALLPIQAEAAKFRSGGRGGSGASTKSSGSLIIVPGIGGASRAKAAEAGQEPQRVPFPPSSTPREEPVLLRLTSTEGAQKPWCGSAVVVGGFCILN